MVTFEDVVNNIEVKELIKNAQKQLDVLGYTEHSTIHVSVVAERAADILRTLGYDEHRIELARIAGYMHDIGNSVNRVDHAHTGAILAYNILKDMNMDASDRTEIMMAIGNHDEHTAFPVNAVAAALILADKTDVRRSRVRNRATISFDIHDRVNYAVEHAELKLDTKAKTLTLELVIDTTISSVMDYFEIFMTRMILCRKAAEYFGLSFRMNINGSAVL